MIKNWRFLVFAIALFSSIPGAQAQYMLAPAQPQHTPLIMEVTPIYVLNAAAPTQKQSGSSLGWTGNVANGFGLLTAFSLFDTPFDLETGAVYMNQISERESNGSTLTQEFHNIQIPLLFRYNFDDKVSIGAGGYMSIATGNITTTYQGSVNCTSYSSLGIHNRDFGLLLSARASLKIVPQFYFIVDGRYQHGLSNLANIPPGGPADLFNTRSMQAFLGLSYRFIPF